MSQSRNDLIETSRQRMDAMQDEVMNIQLKYQKELERLERENKELRKQMLLRGNQKLNNRKIKVLLNFFLPIALIIQNTFAEISH